MMQPDLIMIAEVSFYITITIIIVLFDNLKMKIICD
jgi:hypothetical protein